MVIDRNTEHVMWLIALPLTFLSPLLIAELAQAGDPKPTFSWGVPCVIAAAFVSPILLAALLKKWSGQPLKLLVKHFGLTHSTLTSVSTSRCRENICERIEALGFKISSSSSEEDTIRFARKCGLFQGAFAPSWMCIDYSGKLTLTPVTSGPRYLSR